MKHVDQKPQNKSGKRLLYGLLLHGIILIILFVVAFLISCLYIEKSVKNICVTATESFPGNRTIALMGLISNENSSGRQKTQAIWALGQLGDIAAISFLTEQLETTDGKIYYETQKAIRKLKGRQFNLPGFLWRWTWADGTDG